jgi:putative ABC transport system permease protein
VLRALGANGRQLRAVVHWQANLVAGFVVLIGVPVGILLGTKVVGTVTDALGIVPGSQVPPALVVALVVVVGLAANLLALLPARQAARATMRVLTHDR